MTMTTSNKWVLIGGVTAAVLSASCMACCGLGAIFGGNAPTAPPPSASVTPPPPPPPIPATLPAAPATSTASVQPSAGIPSAPPTPVAAADTAGDGGSPAAPQPIQVVDEGLPGIGALREHWNATHVEARGFAPGRVYGPNLAGGQPIYASVLGDERIFAYALHFPPATSWNTALALARLELPADAREVATRNLGACRMVRYRSATLRQIARDGVHSDALGRHGEFEIGFYSDGDQFDARRVTNASVGFYLGFPVDC